MSSLARALGQPEAATLPGARTPPRRGRHSSAASGRRSPRRSASQRSSGPGPASRSASVSACPFPRARQPHHARARLLGARCRCVARPVVGDEDVAPREGIAQRGHRRADPLLLVAGGNEDRQPLAHASLTRSAPTAAPRVAAGRSSRSRRPRSAPSRRRRARARARGDPPRSRRCPPSTARPERTR